jgi:hypothetical protein
MNAAAVRFVHFHTAHHDGGAGKGSASWSVFWTNTSWIDLYLRPFAKPSGRSSPFHPRQTPRHPLPAADGSPGRKNRPKKRALALVTGDSIGQVASQTLENLYTSAIAQLPSARP